MNSVRTKSCLLQYFKIAFPTLNANHRYSGGICFRTFSITRSLPVIVRHEQETRSLFVLIKMAFSIYIRRKVFSRLTTVYVIVSIATIFSRIFFSSFTFSIVSAFVSSRKRCCSYFTSSNSSIPELLPIDTEISTYMFCANAFLLRLVWVYVAPLSVFCVCTSCDSTVSTPNCLFPSTNFLLLPHSSASHLLLLQLRTAMQALRD